MNDDGSLLRQFVNEGDEACFRKLVERRIGFVYAITLRRLRDPHLAQDATQAVFVALARKAAHVARCPNVMGWLHRSSCYESRNLLRGQIHRAARETEALRRAEIEATPPALTAGDGTRADVAAVIDDVLSELPKADRDAILARFFSDQSYTEIGAVTGRTENAARMRVERALAKLRDRLQRRGFDSSAAVLATALPAYANTALPAGVTTTVTQAALLGVSTATIPAAFFAAMNVTKIATVVTVLAAASVVGYEVIKTNRLEGDLRALRAEHAKTTNDFDALQKQVTVLNAAAATAAKAATDRGAANPAVVPTRTEPADVPGITRKAPAGWHKNGSNTSAYDVGVDQIQQWGGMPSAYVKSIATPGDNGFGGMMQTTSADTYREKRVKLTGWVKTADANEGGHLWLRIDGRNASEMLGFDNMNQRAPKGTTDWQEYSVVLDVPKEASSLNYGFFVKGSGAMWVNGLTIQPVGNEVPTTNMLSAQRQLPKAPVNLGFTPN